MKKNRWSKVGLTGLIVTTIIVSGLAIAYSRTDLAEAASKYDENKAAAEKAGMFFTRSQVDALYKISPSQNGATLIEQSYPNTKLPLIETEQIAKANWSRLKPGLEKLEAASKFPTAIFKKPGGNRFEFNSKGTEALRFWTRTLPKLIEFSAAKNNFEATKHYYDLMAFIVNIADDDKDGMSVIIKAGYAHKLEASIRQQIPLHGQDSKWRSMLESTLRKIDKPYDLLTLLKIDHMEVLEALAMLRKENLSLKQSFESDMFSAPIRFNRYLPRFEPASKSRIHEVFAGVAKRLPNDPYDFMQVKTAYEYGQKAIENSGWSYCILQELTSGFDLARAVAREQADRNALFQALALLQTKADPAKGLPLKGRFQTDVDGNPIRIKKLDKGWIVYSIWGDGADDGGKEIKDGHGDWVVHLSLATVPPPDKSAAKP